MQYGIKLTIILRGIEILIRSNITPCLVQRLLLITNIRSPLVSFNVFYTQLFWFYVCYGVKRSLFALFCFVTFVENQSSEEHLAYLERIVGKPFFEIQPSNTFFHR